MFKKIASLSIIVILFSSCYLGKCPNKNSFISGFQAFTTGIEEQGTSDRTSADKEFYQYMNDCYTMYADQLTNEEKGKIWLAAAEYYTEKYEGRLDKAFDEAKEKLKPEVLVDFEKFMETYPAALLKNTLGTGIKALSKFLKGVGKEIKPELEKLGKELEKTTKEVAEELEKLEGER